MVRSQSGRGRDRGAELRATPGGCLRPPLDYPRTWPVLWLAWTRSEASIRAHLCSLAPASAFRPLKAGDAEHPQRISLGRHLSTRLIGSIKADPMTVLQPHETGSCALISVQDGQRRVRHLLAASRGCPPRTHAAAPSGCIGRLWVPQDYSSRGRALERRRYTCADVARVKWLLVQGRRQVVGLSVVSACSRECSTVCDSHGYSWVGHGAGGRSGAPQQPPRLTPIQFDTSIPTVEPQLQPVISRADWHLRSSSWAVLGSLGGVLEGGKQSFAPQLNRGAC